MRTSLPSHFGRDSSGFRLRRLSQRERSAALTLGVRIQQRSRGARPPGRDLLFVEDCLHLGNADELRLEFATLALHFLPKDLDVSLQPLAAGRESIELDARRRTR